VKRIPDYFNKGFFEACGALIGLVVSDNLLGFTKTPYSNEIAGGVATVVILIGVLSENRSWHRVYWTRVQRIVSWMFAAMGLIILGTSGEKQLGVFSGPPLSVFNVGVAVYLFLGIALTVPFFLLADWNREEPKIRSVPTIFNPDFIIDND